MSVSSTFTITTAGGYTCVTCQAWVPYGQAHICPNLTSVPQQFPAGHTCPVCWQWVYGYHSCPGYRAVPYVPPVAAAPAPEPETRPEPPLAALVADLRGLLGKAQRWLESKRL